MVLSRESKLQHVVETQAAVVSAAGVGGESDVRGAVSSNIRCTHTHDKRQGGGHVAQRRTQSHTVTNSDTQYYLGVRYAPVPDVSIMEMILHSHLLLARIGSINCHKRTCRREERAVGHAGRAHVRDVGHADVVRDAKRPLFGVNGTLLRCSRRFKHRN